MVVRLNWNANSSCKAWIFWGWFRVSNYSSVFLFFCIQYRYKFVWNFHRYKWIRSILHASQHPSTVRNSINNAIFTNMHTCTAWTWNINAEWINYNCKERTANFPFKCWWKPINLFCSQDSNLQYLHTFYFVRKLYTRKMCCCWTGIVSIRFVGYIYHQQNQYNEYLRPAHFIIHWPSVRSANEVMICNLINKIILFKLKRPKRNCITHEKHLGLFISCII